MWRRFRPIIGLQILSTAAATLLSGWLAGNDGAISAALGGLIGIVAGLVYAALAARGRSSSAGEALYAALRAEAVKVALMIFFLWFVLKTYQDAVVVALVGAFIATVLIFATAILVRET